MAKKKLPKKTVEQVKERAKGCCEYCQIRENFCPENFPSDHIEPTSKGGDDSLENLASSCHGCNWNKSNKTTGIDPETQLDVPLFHPRKQNWKDHFEWEEGYLKIKGLTSVGRATIVTLKMNRSNLMNLRYALFMIGVHPPRHTL